MNKEIYLENQAKKFGKLLKIELPIEIKKDNNFKSKIGISLYVYTYNNKPFYLIKYDFNLLNKLTKANILHATIHELYHVKLGHLDISDKKMNDRKRIKCEYNAERKALIYIKKYLPKYYIRAVRYTKKLSKTSNKIYMKAFKKVLEEL